MDIRTNRTIMAVVFMLMLLFGGLAEAGRAGEAELRGRYAELMPGLEDTPYGQPVQIDSSMDKSGLRGEVYMVLDAEYQNLSRLLAEHRAWCDIILLDLVIKGCIYRNGDVPGMTVYIGDAGHTSMDSAYRIDYRFEVLEQTGDYAGIRLSADNGPLGTRDYELMIELVPVGDRTFARMQVSLRTGWRCRFALNTYLATLGRSKVGFTRDGGDEQLVRGVRGLIERSVMRQLLGLQAYLSTRSQPANRRFEASLAAYHAGILSHARQLQELDRADYMAVKRMEYRAQLEAQAAVTGARLVVAQSYK